MNKNLIVKFIASIICIVIMSVIIFFVYNYYSDEAKKGKSSSNTNTNENTNTSTDPEKPDKPQTDELNFIEFKNIKTYIDGFDNKIIMNYEMTDAGNVLTINEHSVTYYSSNDKVYYGILKDAIVIKVVSPTEGITLVFSDNEGTAFKQYTYDNQGKYNLYIKEPVMSSNIKDAITFDKSTFTISYSVMQDSNNSIVLTNDETLNINTSIFADTDFNTYDIVEYTLEIEYLGNKKFTEAEKLEEFTLKEYVNKYAY